ncbi:hypothetical protein [Nocardioides sp. GXQ0305]|uniref:hypothetical protein n=1 Tax=Nocardioides sp. GXQ0305 TaxID=3423912 RepID=UPI003D7E747D
MPETTDPQELYHRLADVLEEYSGIDVTDDERRDEIFVDFCRDFLAGSRPGPAPAEAEAEAGAEALPPADGQGRWPGEIHQMIEVAGRRVADLGETNPLDSEYASGVLDGLVWATGAEPSQAMTPLVDAHVRRQRALEVLGEHQSLIAEAAELFGHHDGSDGPVHLDEDGVSSEYARGVVELLLRQLGLDADDADSVCEALRLAPGTAEELHVRAAHEG